MSISTRGPSQEGNYNKLLIPKMMVLTFSALNLKMMTSFGSSQKPATLKGIPPVLYYQNKNNGEEEYSSVQEVRAWCNQTTLKQAINKIKPTRKGYINTLAEEFFKAITYNLKLPPNSTKPTSLKKAGNHPQPQWFRAEEN